MLDNCVDNVPRHMCRHQCLCSSEKVDHLDTHSSRIFPLNDAEKISMASSARITLDKCSFFQL